MNPLVPADEESNPFLDADLGPEPELPAGPPQVGVREPHVPRLVAVALDPHLAAERARDELDQPVEPHPRTSADVDPLADPPGARPRRPAQGPPQPPGPTRYLRLLPPPPPPPHPRARRGP